MLLNISNSHLWWQGKAPELVQDVHRPFLLAWPRDGAVTEAHDRLVDLVGARAGEDPEQEPLAKVHEVLEPTTYDSFWNHGRRREVVPVVAKRSYWVPDISDTLFFDHGFCTAEHDIPYTERATADLAADRDWWLLDSKGHPARLKVLTYDIETTQYGQKQSDIPVDVIGYSEFDVGFTSQKDLDEESFDFRFTDLPSDWAEREVEQLVSHDLDAEMDHLMQFTQHVRRFDVVAGHNVLGFDNKQVHERIQDLLRRDQREETMSPGMRSWFQEFVQVHSRPDKSFHFGTSQDTCVWYPITLDTYHAARKFYFFHDDFTLKGLAPWLGIKVPDRIYMDPDHMKLDGRTLDYNRHDVQEQTGLTMSLLAQALPLCFTVGLSMSDLLTGGNTKMWDHMALIRARRRRKIMPATCRAQGVARGIQRLLPKRPFPTREEVAEAAAALPLEERAASGNRELLRVVKQGPEMPVWCEHPNVIVRPDVSGSEHGYAIVGGMTLKPDTELKSHFVPWFHVVAADVGAMYPTILKARNLTADTVRPARSDEVPDDWIWLLHLDDAFARSGRYHVRQAEKGDPLTKGRGWMVGVVHAKAPGLVNLAMTGVLDTIQKVKEARARAKADGAPADELRVHDMTYASLKAARNAGTHGILVAVNVSCRQFNVWGGANITTIGQRVLQGTLDDFGRRGIRTVYGDSITGDRNVVVRDPRGRMRVLPIEELFGHGEAPHVWHGKEAVRLPGWHALSAHPDQPLQGAWKPLVRAIRHQADKPVVRVRQVEGETVCTEEHSLMLADGDRAVRAPPAQACDRPMVRVVPPEPSTVDSIDLLEWVQPLAADVVGACPPNHLFSPPRRTFAFHHDDEWMWFHLHTRPDLGPQRLRRHIRLGTPESRAFFRLLGAYVSEGSVTFNGSRRGASIAGPEPWLQEFRHTVAWLFENVRTSIVASDAKPTRTITTASGTQIVYNDTTHKLQMTNVIAATLFWALGGKGSRNKRVPDLLWNAPASDRQAFLEAAVEGDGSRSRDPRYRAAHHDRHFSYATSSVSLASGMSMLLTLQGYDHGIRRRADKSSYILWTRDARRPFRGGTVQPVAHAGPVYDLEVEENHTFVDAMGGILLHNTDGIYLACSRSAGNLPHLAAALGADVEPVEDRWITMPDEALAAVKDANRRWREELAYPAFELEAEVHDAMVFVVHKNYLIFDVGRDGAVRMETKGNNFKGSDKAPLAQHLLREIMVGALREVAEWDDEDKAREAMQTAIKRATKELMQTVQVTETPWDDLILRQSVQPIRNYKPNPDGTLRSQAVRTAALEHLMGERFTATRKLRFVVCREPLPLYRDPRAQAEMTSHLTQQGHRLEVKEPGRKGLKPIEYMWPVDQVKPQQVDWVWYKSMVEDYVKGAFGFPDLELAVQRDLSSWF